MESQQGKSMCVCVRKPNEKVWIFDIFFLVLQYSITIVFIWKFSIWKTEIIMLYYEKDSLITMLMILYFIVQIHSFIYYRMCTKHEKVISSLLNVTFQEEKNRFWILKFYLAAPIHFQSDSCFCCYCCCQLVI